MSRPWRQTQKPRISPDEVKFAEFSGVVNTRSRKDIGMSALFAGDNVLISDTKKVVRRDGYSLHVAGSYKSAYGCGDRLYAINGSNLVHVASPTDVHTISTGLTGTRYSWDTINGDAYFVNGVEAGIVRGDTLLPWRITAPGITLAEVVNTPSVPTTFNVGQTYTTAKFRIVATHETSDGREGPPGLVHEINAAPLTNLLRVQVSNAYARVNIYCTEADGTVFRFVAATTGGSVTFNPARGGRELTTLDLSGLPEGVTDVAFCKGRAYAVAYLPTTHASVVWKSRPFAYHLFNLAKDFFVVPGQVGLLLSNNKGVLVGTSEYVYQYDNASGELEELADYGVVPGNAGDTDAEGMAYFWTVRGLCQAHPFKNLTEQDVSMPPGSRAVAAMVYLNGLQQFITVTQGGGTAFNTRRERT